MKQNETDLSPFSLRLMGMMKESGYPTPARLAKKLLDEKLLKSSVRMESEDEAEKVKAIESVRKKINAHLNAQDSSCLQGEFALAYKRFFGCSLEYLFMESNIFAPKLEVDEICNWTGLDETSVIKLIKAHYKEITTDEDVFSPSLVWSMILQSDLFEIIPKEYDEALTMKNYAVVTAEQTIRAVEKWKKAENNEEKKEIWEEVEELDKQSMIYKTAAEGLMMRTAITISEHLNRDLESIFDEYELGINV